MRTPPRAPLRTLIAIPFAGLIGVACGSSNPTGPVGGPVTGALDTHCSDGDGGVNATPVGMCMMGGVAPDGGVSPIDYGPTLFNAEGDDDDCKYHVVWTSTPVRKDTNVTFTLMLTKLAAMTPATQAGVTAEVFLTDTHPAAPPPEAKESAGGTYTIGPVKFDAPGDWTVRFHFYGNCSDVPADSPHGHAAFFVRVPDPSADAAAD